MHSKTTQTTLSLYDGYIGGIDRAATIAKFGYDPDTLSRGSRKRVVAVCMRCGKARDIQKRQNHDVCYLCAMKTPEARRRQSAIMKKRFKDPKAREKNSIAQKKRFEDSTERRKNSARVKKYFKDPKAREKQSVAQKKRWEKPEEHVKCSVAQKKRYANHDEREKQSAIMKKRFKDDPEAHNKASAAAKKHFKDNPYTLEDRKRLSARHQNIPYEEWESFARDQPYCPKFNEACRESNREKYSRRCFICDLPESENITKNGKQRKLSVHHVDMNKEQGCDGHDWRLIPTCMHHHSKAIHTPLWMARIAYLLRVGV